MVQEPKLNTILNIHSEAVECIMTAKCNITQTIILNVFCGSPELWTLFVAVSAVMVFSLFWNIFCCYVKLSSDKGKTFLPRFRRSLSLRLRDMEDNPIYGNITYTQTRVDPPICPSSIRNSKGQDYANLTLKAPKPMSGRNSPKIEYSDVVTLQVSQEAEKMVEGNTDTVSILSDLYASVQTNRAKTLDTVEGNEDYANHV